VTLWTNQRKEVSATEFSGFFSKRELKLMMKFGDHFKALDMFRQLRGKKPFLAEKRMFMFDEDEEPLWEECLKLAGQLMRSLA
jgi:hypothetical protein